MEGVDSVTQGLYFSAAQAAAAEAASQAKKKEDAKKTGKVRKNLFASALEKSQEEFRLKSEGFPPEIAGMPVEEAAVFLKDRADLAAEKMKKSQLTENFADYRQKVSQFMRFIVKNNYQVVEKKRVGLSRTGKRLPPQTQVVMINKKLDEMAQWLLHSHNDTLTMLAKIDEIKGLLVDLMAA